ncbi:hypothetical protein A2356_00840 [Candidatus Nomurabacteria bacterium RIFOXYB1_FULL_39_16]|uniref:Uncharacterized protein n=1 Tax=Candidatus Nomurabacteria bacterium RIFOXYB1_FULL_39_16 TaxID=1801803 RepID=A0A1F6YSP0_9BACT|nr:MAG: hypothetical protein A2356_00840 [Candidatus Nomurabacteria bacterium RIFOXYB1_FULL_39_16]OGJ15358.1 MAG: hypothetical protein A2585_02425 [Candidatus Nomurabacteria bacterium RIFOXYD1_FULL_39_12]
MVAVTVNVVRKGGDDDFLLPLILRGLGEERAGWSFPATFERRGRAVVHETGIAPPVSTIGLWHDRLFSFSPVMPGARKEQNSLFFRRLVFGL